MTVLVTVQIPEGHFPVLVNGVEFQPGTYEFYPHPGHSVTISQPIAEPELTMEYNAQAGQLRTFLHGQTLNRDVTYFVIKPGNTLVHLNARTGSLHFDEHSPSGYCTVRAVYQGRAHVDLEIYHQSQKIVA